MLEFTGSRQFQLLVSVRDPVEARDAVLGGADIVDVKEPNHGPLGRAEGEVIQQVLGTVRDSGSIPVSAALGDLMDWEGVDLSEDRFLRGLAYAKLGMKGERERDWQDRFLAARSRLSPWTALIPVAYADAESADAPPVAEIVDFAIACKAPAVLLDTYSKTSISLWDLASESDVRAWVQKVQGAGSLFAVAGSLSRESLHRLRTIRPAIVAVRGAACSLGRRDSAVHQERVAELARELASLRDSVVGTSVAP